MRRPLKINTVCTISVVLVVLLTGVLPIEVENGGRLSDISPYSVTVASAAGQPDEIGGSLHRLIREKEHGVAKYMPQLRSVLDVLDELGGANVSIRFDHKLRTQEVGDLESAFGIKFHRVDGRIQDWISIYSAIVPWSSIDAVARLPFVSQIDTSIWPPPMPALDTSIPEAKADRVWALQDGQGRPVTGKGTTIADYDTGIDIFHPAMWQPDPGEPQYPWNDTSNNGYFTPGQATINWPGYPNPVPLRHINAENAPGNTSGFEPNLDWLYADLNGNGVRDYGIDNNQFWWAGGNKYVSIHNGTAGSNFTENDKSYGEPIFAANDANGNGRLDAGETLIALSVSKVYMTYFYMPGGVGMVSAKRGDSANPLIMTPKDPGGHGTSVAGILSAGVQAAGNHSRYTGMAPEMAVKNAQNQWVGGLMIAEFSSGAISFTQFQEWAQIKQAQVMLYESGHYVGRFLDGTDDVEIKVKTLAESGMVQVIPAGNSALNPGTGNTSKHFQADITSGQPQQDIPFPVPAGLNLPYITQSILWTNNANALKFKMVLPKVNPNDPDREVDLGVGSSTPQTFTDVYGYNMTITKYGPSNRGTVRVELDINCHEGTASVESGNWKLRVTRGDGSPPDVEVNGYMWDRSPWYFWMGGIEYSGSAAMRTSKTIMFPATADKAIVVGAYSDANGNIEGYSGRGPRIDGTQIMDIAAPSPGTWTSQSSGISGGVYASYTNFNGTSAAAPHVAGAVALMLQANPSLTHDDVETRLKATATVDAFTGDPPEGGTWGAGKLNIYSAFTKVAVKLVSDGLDSNGRAAATVKMDSVKNYFTGVAVGGPAPIPGGITSFEASVSKGSGSTGITIMNVSPVAPFNSTSTIQADQTVFSGQSSGQSQPPVGVAKLAPRLTGASNVAYPITLTFQKIHAYGGGNYTADPYTCTWLRGDASPSGSITIVDALLIAQYLAGLTGLGEGTGLVHPVNAASPKQEITSLGEVVNIADALFIAQMLAMMRDSSYNRIRGMGPSPGSATGPGGALLDATTVQVNSATLPPAGSAQIPIRVRNISDAAGLGGYDFKLTFNPQVIRVDDVPGGSFPWPTSNIDNTSGVVSFNAFRSTMPGPTGNVIVAYLAVTAVGGSGSSTPLNISITTLGNSNGGDIPATTTDGTVTIQ